MTGSTVVIGAAQGIGAAVAERLAREPWVGDLVLADVKVEAVEKMASELHPAAGRCTATQVDLSDQASIDRLVASYSDADQVAIVAGIFAASPALESTKEEFDRILAVNLVGTFLAAQGFARHMVERGDGSICGVASIAARMPRMRQAAYAASKAGMRQAFRVLGLETVPRGVTVNTVSPGMTDTPMMRLLNRDHPGVGDFAQGSPEAFRPKIPGGRIATVEEIASGVAFLLDPQNRHIALHDLVIDGGELLGM
jgi:2,3-dihydro-2,3-dihydroxybenzoate dehydrogenase